MSGPFTRVGRGRSPALFYEGLVGLRLGLMSGCPHQHPHFNRDQHGTSVSTISAVCRVTLLVISDRPLSTDISYITFRKCHKTHADY